MADFERRQFEIGLEFLRWSFDERNNFSEGSSEPKKYAQVIRVRGAAAPQVFLTRITCFTQYKQFLIKIYACKSLNCNHYSLIIKLPHKEELRYTFKTLGQNSPK